MEDSKRSKKLIFKLFVLLCFNIFAIQPDFFPLKYSYKFLLFYRGVFFITFVYRISFDSKFLLVFLAL